MKLPRECTDRLIRRIGELSRPMEPVPTQVEPTRRHVHGIRAVLFDVYGTLLISGSGDVGTAMRTSRAEALMEAAGQLGITLGEAEAEQGLQWLHDEIGEAHRKRREEGVLCPEVDICRIWHRVFERLHDAGLQESRPDAQELARLAVEYECRVNPVWPMPGALETVHRLHAAGLRLGIVSNAQFYTPLLFKALFAGSPRKLGFAEDLCSWSWQHLEAKPSVNLFRRPLQALDMHDIAPQQTLYVGNDMLNDIWTAREAGCKTALFAGDDRSLRMRRDVDRCRGLKPTAVVNRLESLLELLSLTS